MAGPRFQAALLALALVPLAPACDGGAAAPSSHAGGATFDAARAWSDLERIVALGPRPAGTPALERTRALIETELRAAGLAPVRETFRAETPAGPIEFANVYADLAAGGPAAAGAETLILCTHFDTKRTAERFPEPFVGANDGGSGTAVLLELARVIARGGARPLTYRFLFLDGEEALLWGWTDAEARGLSKDNTYGSRHHAGRLKQSGAAERVRACIVLDMVGDRDLRFFRDRYSDRRLLDVFSRAAKQVGLARHVDGRAEEVYDDHIPFLDAGIPSVDLIDLDFGPANSYWHTPKDDLERCSQASLAATGAIVLAALPEIESGFRRR